VIGLRLAAMASGLLVLMAIGCTNSDPLTPSSGAVLLELRAVNPDPRWEFQEFGVHRIQLRPIDESAQEASDGRPFGVLPGPTDVIIDFTGITGLGTIESRNVPTGEYVLSSVTLSNIRLEDYDPPPPGTCEEMVVLYPTQGLATVARTGQVVRVDPDGTTLGLTFDGAAFVEAYRSSWFPCGGPTSPGEFFEPLFATTGDTFIEVN
jgi:hypothetical protein